MPRSPRKQQQSRCPAKRPACVAVKSCDVIGLGKLNHVTDTAHGSNQIGRQLSSQMMDMHVECIALDVFIPAVQPLLQRLTRHDATAVDRKSTRLNSSH